MSCRWEPIWTLPSSLRRLNAAGASYIGTATEHLANRGMFAGAQDLAAATYTATDVINNAALGLA